MGRNFVTVKQACAILGLSESSIRTYIKKGYLKAGQDKNDLEAAGVLELQRLKEAAPPFDKIVLAKLQEELRETQLKLQIVMRTLSVGADPLKLPDERLALLHGDAKLMSEVGCPREMEEMWLDLLSRLEFEDLLRLEALTKDPNPWRPFLYLMEQLVIRGRRALRPGFDTCKRHLRLLAMTWIETRKSLPIEAALPDFLKTKLTSLTAD